MATTELRKNGADLSRLKSDKQRQFALEWLIDEKPKAAAIRAGYAEGGAANRAQDLLKNPIIKAFHGKFIREALEKRKIDIDGVIDQLYNSLHRQVRDFVDSEGRPLSPEKLPDKCQSIVDGFKAKVLKTKTLVDGETEITEELVEIEYKLTPHATARQQALLHRGLLEAVKVDVKHSIDWDTLAQGRPDVILDPVKEALGKQSKAPKIIEEEK